MVLVAAMALRCQGLAARSLWFDEAFTWRLVSFSWTEMCQRISEDNSPPLYYLLLKAWMGLFGDTPLALRSLSVLLGGVTMVGAWLFAREAFGRSARGKEIALLAAALVAMSVFQIRYAWEVRPYALGTALAALSSWALFRALHAPDRAVRPWLLYAALALPFLYTHNYTLFSVAAQGLFALGYLLVRADWDLRRLAGSPTFRGALLAGSIIAAGWLPWMPVFLRQRAQVQAAFWTPAVNADAVARVCFQMLAEPEGGWRSPRQYNWIALDLCALGLLALWRKARAGEWYVLCAVLVPLGLSVLVSTCDTKIFSLRYFLFAHVFLLLGVAVLVGRIRYRLERGAVVLLVLANAAWAYLGFWEKVDVAHKPGFRAAAAYIQERRGAGEPVLVCSPLAYLPIRYHCRPEVDCHLFDDGREIPHYYGRAALTPEDFLNADRLRAGGPRRVWAVNLRGGYWGNVSVPMPPRWTPVSTTKFAEVLGQGEVWVVEYAAEG
jgi:mannosyltransferase